MVLVLRIELIQGVLFVDDFVLEVPYDFLKLMDVGSSLVLDLVALLVALVLRPAHVKDVLGGWLAKRCAYFLHSFFVDCLRSCLENSRTPEA